MIDITPPLSVTLAPLVATGAFDIRSAIAAIADAGFQSAQLSAALPGLRPRELSQRARKDVLATLGRKGLALGGIDLMIPHNDWLKDATQDKALAATLATIELAADLGQTTLALTLPVENLPDDITNELIIAADGRNVPLAVHAEHNLPALKTWLARFDTPALGAAIDPAALLGEDEDPINAVIDLASRVRAARLDDWRTTSAAHQGGRCPLGTGALEVLMYRGALTACPGLRNIVVELRNLTDPLNAMTLAARAWQDAGH